LKGCIPFEVLLLALLLLALLLLGLLLLGLLLLGSGRGTVPVGRPVCLPPCWQSVGSWQRWD
jgi:hypothetical protein